MADEWTNVTISKGNITAVEVSVSKDEEILNKVLTKITPPEPDKEADGNITLILDLKNIERRINIDGHLVKDTTSTSSEKKRWLIEMFKAGGVLTMTYEGSNIDGNIEKLMINKIMFDGGEPNLEEAGHSLKFTFLVGNDMV